MSLRLALIFTILFGGSALLVSQFIVRPYIQQLAAGRAKAVKEYQRERTAHEKTTTALKETEARLVATESSLREAKSQIASTTTKANEQEQRANKLNQELTSTKQTLANAQADLAPWNSLDVPVNQIKNVISEVKKLRVTNDAMQEEMKLLATALQKARKGNIPTDSEPALPIALKGKILAVDPKYDFVVLDIGAAQGVEERGALLVNRNSKLIAKVKVARVQQNRCIANIVADWKFDTVLEGDQVIVQ